MTKNKNISYSIGLLLIILGIVINKYSLGYFFSVDGEIGSFKSQLVILLVQISLLISGGSILYFKPIITIVNIFVSITSSLIITIIGATLIQIFYKPQEIVFGWRTFPKEGMLINQLGFRGKNIDYDIDDYIILLLGDSQVEAENSRNDWTPEYLLEKYLNETSDDNKYKVFTIGTKGYGQDQQLLVLEEYFKKYRADAVVLWFTPANDVWNNIFPTHWPSNGTPKPTFWLENDELMGPSEKMNQKFELSQIKIVAMIQSIILSKKSLDDRDGYWERYLPKPYAPIDYTGVKSNPDWEENWDSVYRNENLMNEKTHWQIRLTPRSERTEYGLRLTRKLLLKIQKIINENDGEFHIMTTKFPNENPNIEVYSLNGNYYKISGIQEQENINYIMKEFEYFEVPVSIDSPFVSENDHHLNEYANSQVFKDLSKIIKSNSSLK